MAKTFRNLSTDTTLGGNAPSDYIAPSQKALKTYIDNNSGLPDQTGNSGKYLTTNGTSASWNSLATVATSGSYSDLSNKPTISDLTTTTQLAAINSGATTTNIGQIATNTSDISTINGKIPSQASTSNQLADKAFVNSTVQTNTANFRGNWATWAAVPTAATDYPEDYSGNKTPTVNDYLVVQDASGYTGETLTGTWRFKYSGTWATEGKSGWLPEYQVNETPMTAAQLEAINSGITSTMVGYLTNVTSDIQTQINGKQATVTGGASTITSNNLTASKALISNSSGKVAVSDTTSTELGYVHGVTSAIQTQIDSKLNKLTYEWNKEIGFGSTGKLCIGKFCCYDSNITIDIDATTSTTYHGTLVIALQNIGTSSGGSLVATVYGDATNTIAPNIYIYKHGVNDCLVEVYFSPLPWSKNIIHIRAVTLNKDHGSVSYDSVAFDLCTSVSEIPATATIKPTNALDSKQATLVSGTNIKTINNNSILGSGNLTVDGLPSQSGQSGKYLTTNGTSASWATVGDSGDVIPYGTSDTEAATVQKEVSIPSITSLKTGQIIIVQPSITSTVADSTLKLNNFTAYPMRYGTAAITTSTDSIVWAANYPSWFRFDGEYWQFIGHGVDNNTTYSAMTTANGIAGTETTSRLMRADRLKPIIQGTTLTGLSTSTNSAVVATDSITVGIGKLQAQVNSKQATLVSGTNIKTINSTSLLGSGNISITGLPSQTSQSGKFLTTNGTSASWSNAPGATMTYDSTTETLTIS